MMVFPLFFIVCFAVNGVHFAWCAGSDAAIYTTDNAASASIVAAVAATYVINLAKVVRFVLVVAVAIISCLIAK